MDFIFLNEEEKEKYFTTGNILYIKNKNIDQNNFLLNNFNSILNSNYITNNNKKSECIISKNLSEYKNNNLYSLSSEELHNIFQHSINHILLTKPFYMSLKNINMEAIELEYILKDLSKSGVNINELLYGFLDPISHLL